MAVAFQLSNNTTLLNISHTGDMIDLCYPNKGEANLLLRGGIYDDIYLDSIKLTPNYELGYLNIDTTDNALLVANLAEFRLEKTFGLYENYLSKCFKFSNHSDRPLKITILTLADIDFGSNSSRDTAVRFPLIDAVIHYEEDHYVAIFADQKPTQFGIQANGDFSGRGAAPDKNLELTGNPVSTGKVQSCLKYELEISAGAEKTLEVFYLFGKSYTDIIQNYRAWEASRTEKASGPPPSIEVVEKVNQLAELLNLSEAETKKLDLLYRVSRNLVAGSFSKVGGNFAAVDSSFFKQGGVDDYSYFWPRDGALAFWAYTKDSGKHVTAQFLQNFFNYLERCFSGQPYLLHRYRLNDTASLASSWHIWADRMGNPRLPIQLDQTALAAFAYGKYLRQYQQSLPQFEALLEEVAIFLIQQIDPETGLHQPSYNLWENEWGQFLSTQTSVIAALKELMYVFSNSNAHRDSSRQLVEQLERQYKLAELQLSHYFHLQDGPLRGAVVDDFGSQTKDYRADASVHWLWQLGVLEPRDPRLTMLVESQAQKLAVNGAFARFEDDSYLRVAENTPGNPWYISTLWFAQYYLHNNDLDKAKAAISYILEHMDNTGLLPEMADPHSGFALSVKPLIWSHVEVLNLVNWNLRV